MGIPAFFSYIVKNHANIIKKLSSNTIKVDNLYLDCNSIIYDAVHSIDTTNILDNQTFENEIIEKVIININNKWTNTRPN
jgi:5'-3' exonuclease